MKAAHVVCATVAMACGTGVSAQGIPSWSATPYSYTQNPQLFYALFARARTQTVRLLLLGDSQETISGMGIVYVPRLNFEFWLRYGNCPETPLIPAGIMTGPPCDWLGRNQQWIPTPSVVSMPAGWLPPGVLAYGWGTAAINIGNLVTLEHDAASTDPGVQAAGAFSYLDTSAGVRLEVVAATSPGSGDVAWLAKPGPVDSMYWNPVTQSGTLGLSLAQNPLAAVSGLTDIIGYAGQAYMHVDLYGTDDSHPTTILGSRFRSVAKPYGVVVSSLSAGGYQVTSYLANHGNSGSVLSALGFDAVVIGYGANDAGVGVTPQQFSANLAALIAQLRTWLGAGVPVILLSDPYRTQLTPAQDAMYDLYPGAEYLLAQSDPLVLTVNSRRATEDLGWGAPGTPWLYLADAVHYTALGARTKAHAEALILDQYMWGGSYANVDHGTQPRSWRGGTRSEFLCYANCDHSTLPPVLNVQDFTCFLQKFASQAPDANCDGSTTPPVLNVVDFSCFLQKYASGCS